MKLIDQINPKKLETFNELIYLTGLAYIIDETQKQKESLKEGCLADKNSLKFYDDESPLKFRCGQ